MEVRIDTASLCDDVQGLVKAMDKYRDEVGGRQVVVVRKCTIALLKSIRAQTARSAKVAPARDVTKYDGPSVHYIRPKGKGQVAQHRYRIRRRGGEDERIYVNAADSKTDARQRFGKYTRWGLAKKSWGLAMAALFKRSEPSGGNTKAKVNPSLIQTRLDEIPTGPNPRIEVEVVNKLGYITSATPESVVGPAITAATNSINWQIQKALDKAKEKAGLA